MRVAALCRVKLYRDNRGMSQEKLSQVSGLTRQTIINVEKGKTIPSVLHAMQIARALGVPVEDLYYRVEFDAQLHPNDEARGVVLVRWPKG